MSRRPYRVESTSSLPTSEVKQPRAVLPAFVPFRFPGQQNCIAHCQVALIEQLPGTLCDHICHRSHFGSRYSSGRCDFAVFFWCHHSKKPIQGFEQGLNKVSSFQAVPTQDPLPNAYLYHFQSAFCPTLPTPPMLGASKWGQILFSNALLLLLLHAAAGSRTRGTSMGGLYVAATLQAP